MLFSSGNLSRPQHTNNGDLSLLRKRPDGPGLEFMVFLTIKAQVGAMSGQSYPELLFCCGQAIYNVCRAGNMKE
jgi:hypothetical protein